MPNQPTHKQHPAGLIEKARELRRAATPAEQKLWRQLRNRQLHGLKFRRQAALGPFIADFYCHECQLVIELDGQHHAEPEQQRYDAARSEWLESQGLRVVRFSNREVEENLAGVLDSIGGICRTEGG